ncbi:MAG: dockerin type I repeat-containing protein [Prevotella sp.]|nr:dockerin type I repeat-containing protein [Prevotella sp.]
MRPVFLTLTLTLLALTSHAQTVSPWSGASYHLSTSTLVGDVNGDGLLSVVDVTMLVSCCLGYDDSTFITSNADINGDSFISVSDVTALVNLILNNGPKAYLECPDDDHPHMIDLGLPSGTKWACCNVGATAPEGYGEYFAWGETSQKDEFIETNYLYASGTDEDGDGWYDDYHADTGLWGVWQLLGDISGTQYDVAHVKWGGAWAMPSLDQLNELIENCTYEWTAVNGINGGQFTGQNRGKLFIPAAGYRWGEYLYYDGSYCLCWLSTQSPMYSSGAHSIYFGPNFTRNEYLYRGNGNTVRPVSK